MLYKNHLQLNMKRFCYIISFIIFSISAHGQTTWNDKISLASKLKTPLEQIDSLRAIYYAIPKDSSLAIGKVCYLLSYRYKTYFNSKADSLLKYVEIGIEAFQNAHYREYQLSRLKEYKGYALVLQGKEMEGFKAYDDFDNLIMEDDKAIGSYLMAKVDQAIIFRNNGDNEAAIQLLEFAENQPFFAKAFHVDKFRFYQEKSICYGIVDTEEHTSRCDSALFLASNNVTSPKQRLKLLQQKGKIFINRHLYDEAIQAYQNVFQERLHLKTNIDSITALDALNNISYCLIKSNRFQDAIDILNKYVPHFLRSNIPENRKLKILDNLLSAYIEADQTNNILKTIKEIDLLIHSSSNSLHPFDVAIYHYDKAKYYFNQYSKQKHHENFALIALDECYKMDKAIINHENQIITKKAQYLAKKLIDPLYKLPIEIAGNLKNQEDFFYFSERSKNNLLFQDLSNESYDLVKELDLLKAIRDNKEDSKNLIDELVKVRKEKLDYLFLKSERNNQMVADLSTFTNRLCGRFCLNYNFGESNLFLQTIDSKGKTQIFNLGSSFSKKEFETLYKHILNHSSDSIDYASEEFLKHLIDIDLDTTSILILPDDYLFLFPFDILESKVGPMYTLDHSYELNASILLGTTGKPSNSIINTSIVINPSYAKNGFEDENSLNASNALLLDLPYSYDEIEGIVEFVDKTEHKSISKDKLKKYYLESDLFHFSGHAILDANELFSYLPLDAQGTNLYAYEFDNWKTNAKLVVLSACETGSGKVAAGEGVLSFARSIIRSGAASVVSTLWPVNDQSTSEIINRFYKNLTFGQTKSMALANAKKDFLRSCPDYQKHPYYWAGITITGNNNPLIFKSSSKPIWVYLSLLSFLLFFLSLYLFQYLKK
jgi:hypothetical protein